MANGEYYISCVFDVMLRHGTPVKALHAPSRACLGTPGELQENVVMGRLTTSQKRFCFDLDGTLVTHPVVPGDYSSVKPINRTIEMLRELHNVGNHIIIYTARGMRTMNGDAERVKTDYLPQIEATLGQFGIPYDEIVVGKPYADFYIDDLAVNAFHNLEKETGFYLDRIKARTFNEVTFDEATVTKISGNDGELHWYANTPKCIKHYMPTASVMLPNKIIMERIHGISASMMYLNNTFSCAHLDLIVEALDAFHASPLVEDVNVDLAQLYIIKLRERHAMMPAHLQDNAVYERLSEYLQGYCQRLPKPVVMHGDPVFTNIMYDKNGCVKLFDMRGKVGDHLTIAGDGLYDWAKVNQSLLGYDHLLAGKLVSLNALRSSQVYQRFQHAVVQRFSVQGLRDVTMLTAFLLYTLIPLHNANLDLFLGHCKAMLADIEEERESRKPVPLPTLWTDDNPEHLIKAIYVKATSTIAARNGEDAAVLSTK
jgi:capsule biosynthesis phosphatase